MSLPDILQWIATGQKTGTLHLERRSVQKRIVFREGQHLLVVVERPARVARPVPDPRAPRHARSSSSRRSSRRRRRAGSSARSWSATACSSEDDLRRALKAKAEETIYDLFLWPEGQFEFKDGEFPDDVLIHFEIAGDARDHGGHPPRRRVGSASAKVFPSHGDDLQGARARPARRRGRRGEAGPRAGGRGQDPGRDQPGDAPLASSRPPRSLFDLLRPRGRRGGRGATRTSQAPPTRSAPSRRCSALAYQRLQEKRYDAALKAYEEVLALDRLNQNAKKGLIAAIEAREPRARAAAGPARQGARS